MYIKPKNNNSINKFNVHDKLVGKFDDDVYIDSEDYITFSYDNTNGTRTVYKYACTKASEIIEKDKKYYLVVEIFGKVGSFTSITFVDSANIGQFTPRVSSFATSIGNNKETAIFEITAKSDFSKATSMIGTYISFGASTSGTIKFRLSILEEEPTVESFVYIPYGVAPSEDFEVTPEVRDAYKSRGSIKRGKMELVPLNENDDTLVFDESDLKDFTILDDIYTPEQGVIGSVISKQLTLNLFKPSAIDLVNREVDVFVGVMVGEVPKYVSYGRFIIQKPENEVLTEKTSFEAFDFMVKFNLPYEDTLTYPCTVKDVYNAICEQCGVESGTDTFANEDFIVENNQFVAGESCRDVLKAIAQISGTFARIGRDNKLYLSFLKNDSEENFDTSDYNRDIKINNMYGPVNRLVIRMSQVEGENVVAEDTNMQLQPSYLSKNKAPTDISYYEVGSYNAFNGNIMVWDLTIRAKIKIPVNPSTYYYFTTNNDKTSISIRNYDKNLKFISSNQPKGKFKIADNVYWIAIVIYSDTINQDGAGQILFNMLQNGEIKPFIGLDKDKEYNFSEYIPNGIKELVISDNPFMYTQEKREQAKDKIWEIVKGLVYYDYEMKIIPRPFLDSGTNITITDIDNNKINSYLFSHEINFNGGLNGNMSATADTETETKYAFVPELSNRLLHTEIMVDKANQEIIVIAEKNEDNREQIAQQKTTIESITNSVSESKTAIDNITGDLTTIEKSIDTLQQTVSGVTNTLETQGGSNLLLNSSGLFENENWEGETSSITNTDIQNNFIAKACFNLQNGSMKQIINVVNGNYYIGFKYQKLLELANCKILINGTETELTSMTLKEVDNIIEVSEHSITIEIISDTDNACLIGDIIVVQGSKQSWSSNMNEIYTNTVKIGIGLEIISNTMKTKLLANADGVRIVSTVNNKVVAEFTDKGMTTDELKANTAQIAGILIQKNNNQTWISSLL